MRPYEKPYDVVSQLLLLLRVTVAHPKEEENGNETEGIDGLAQSEFSSARPLIVATAQCWSLEKTHVVLECDRNTG
jgi:hypothetical protein